MAISFQENDNFRNDYLLSFLGNENVQGNPEVFDKFYTEGLEEYIFGLTKKEEVNVESLKYGRSVLSYVTSSLDVDSSVASADNTSIKM